MEVMNCRNCKRLFNYITGPMICPACKDKLEKKFGHGSDRKGCVLRMIPQLRLNVKNVALR